jgi:hypothetical protein
VSPTTDTLPLPIEDAWRTIADGLHIHRWFLHPARMLDERANRLLDDAPAALRADPPGPGLLEHLCHPDQAEPAAPVPHASTVDICGARVTAVTADDCFIDAHGLSIVRNDRLGTAPALPPELAGAISSLTAAAGLEYLVQVGVSVLVRGDPHQPTPPGTVAIRGGTSAVDIAADLLAGAAAGWLRLFALSAVRPAQPEPTYDPASWRTAVAPAAESGIRIAVQIRLLQALSGHETGSASRLAGLRERAAQALPEVYTAADALPLIAADLLVTMFPGPRRFAKYHGGGGAGQSHWPLPPDPT